MVFHQLSLTSLVAILFHKPHQTFAFVSNLHSNNAKLASSYPKIETNWVSSSFSSSNNNNNNNIISHNRNLNVLLSSTSSSRPDEEENDKKNDEAAELKAKAESLREQIRNLEANLGENPRRSNNNDEYRPQEPVPEGKTLRNKRVLVVGANGRLGSMVTRYLLRNHPEVGEVVAAVHYVGEASTRGYGRLSYEVGAEDGVGTIGAAWSPEEERNASFQFSDEMKDYNLNKLRVVEVELLDPLQCQTITEGVDCVIWCATDFNGNTPRAVSGLNIAFLFRAVADPTKGRVEIEGLTNILGGLTQSKQNSKYKARLSGEGGNSMNVNSMDEPTSFVLVSPAPDAFTEYETPFGEFNGLKRQGEEILRKDFPSLSHCILQMGKYEDNFVDESLDILVDDGKEEVSPDEKRRRKINRRDAARVTVDSLLEPPGDTVEVWTAMRG